MRIAGMLCSSMRMEDRDANEVRPYPPQAYFPWLGQRHFDWGCGAVAAHAPCTDGHDEGERKGWIRSPMGEDTRGSILGTQSCAARPRVRLRIGTCGGGVSPRASRMRVLR